MEYQDASAMVVTGWPNTLNSSGEYGGLLNSLTRDLAKLRPDVLAEMVLGLKVKPFHRRWLELECEHDRTLLLAPRGHGKTLIGTVAYTLWNIIRNPDVRIAIVASSHSQATEVLALIRGYIEADGPFRRMFGNLRGTTKWTESQLFCRRVLLAREATISAYGADGSIVGRHFDVIILDDVVDEENAWTDGQREKLANWFGKVLRPCVMPTGKLHLIGTWYHLRDLYGVLLDSVEKGEGRWRVIQDSAIGHDGAALWPEEYSLERLDEIRRDPTVGSVLFASQYLNDVSGYRDAIFRADWMQTWNASVLAEQGVSFNRLPKYVGVDLAISQSRDADYFAVVVIATDARGRVFVVDTFRDRLSFDAQVKKIAEVSRSHRPVRVAIESNAYQAALAQHLRKLGGVPVREVRTRTGKVQRAHRISPLFENGLVYLPEHDHRLLDELVEFPRGGHDDLLDALMMAVEEARAGGNGAARSTGVKRRIAGKRSPW